MKKKPDLLADIAPILEKYLEGLEVKNEEERDEEGEE